MSGDAVIDPTASGPERTWCFVFTDIEGSTRLWQEHPEAMRDALQRHDHLLSRCFDQEGARVFSNAGDSFGVAFASVDAAVEAARSAQVALLHEDWAPLPALRVRVGLHLGTAQERGGNFFGRDVNVAARVMSAAHGGQIIASRPTLESAGAVGRALGRHRLRDVQAPVDLVQIDTPGATTEFPPPRTLDAVGTNLPAQITTFVGRESERDELRTLLGEHRLVTLTGPGGAGKTRIAIEVAGDELHHHRDGAFLVELAPLRDHHDVPKALASAVGIQLEGGGGAVGEIVARLAGSDMLVVLDNAEHLLDPVAELVDGLLGETRVTILVTSRERLDLPGERVLALPPLAAETPDSAAVRLFVERALEADAEIGAEDLDEIAELCRALDGVPLAIELAAARARTLSPAVIRARVRSQLDLLARRRGDPRQRTLRATIEWSYELLTDDERSLFRRLGVFEGGLGLEGAVALADPARTPEPVDTLDRLVAKSLVHPTGQSSSRRYGMLETVRAFALDRLDVAGETAHARDLHLDHLRRGVLGDWEPLLSNDRISHERRVQAEQVDLRAALEHAWGQQRWREAAELVAAMEPLWATGDPLAGADWIRRVLPHVAHDPLLEGQLRIDRAWFLAQAEDYAGVEGLFAEELPWCRATANPWTAFGQMVATMVYMAAGDGERAVEAAQQAMAAVELGPLVERGRVTALVFLSAAHLVDGGIERAIDEATSAREALSRDQDSTMWWHCGRVAAAGLYLAGRFAEAHDVVDELDERADRLGYWSYRAHSLAVQVPIHAAVGDAQEVRQRYAESVRRGFGSSQYLGSIPRTLGVLAAIVGEHDVASRLIRAGGIPKDGVLSALAWHTLAEVEQWPAEEVTARRRQHVDDVLHARLAGADAGRSPADVGRTLAQTAIDEELRRLGIAQA